MAFAVCNALNSDQGQTELQRLDAGGQNRVTIVTQVSFPGGPVQQRVSMGGVAAAPAPVKQMRVIADKNPADANSPHIQTAFPQ